MGKYMCSYVVAEEGDSFIVSLYSTFSSQTIYWTAVYIYIYIWLVCQRCSLRPTDRPEDDEYWAGTIREQYLHEQLDCLVLDIMSAIGSTATTVTITTSRPSHPSIPSLIVGTIQFARNGCNESLSLFTSDPGPGRLAGWLTGLAIDPIIDLYRHMFHLILSLSAPSRNTINCRHDTRPMIYLDLNNPRACHMCACVQNEGNANK